MSPHEPDRNAIRSFPVARHGEARVTEEEDSVVVEEPLEIRVGGEPVAVTMRTPGHDAELVLGFLLSEGLVKGRRDLGSIAHCGRPGDEGYGNVMDVAAAPGTAFDADRTLRARRGTLTTAACGVCGRRTIGDLIEQLGVVNDGSRFDEDVVRGLSASLGRAQPVFERTGGLHAAGVATREGRFVTVREDVGRHNAVDKAVGRMLLDGLLPAAGHALVVSGRASFEIVAKAIAAGIPLVVSVSAPSSLAIETAARAAVTLVGFSRGPSFVVYSHAERISRPRPLGP